MDDTKLDPEDLDSPRRELSNGCLEIVVALLVRRRIIFCLFLLGVHQFGDNFIANLAIISPNFVDVDLVSSQLRVISSPTYIYTFLLIFIMLSLFYCTLRPVLHSMYYISCNTRRE